MKSQKNDKYLRLALDADRNLFWVIQDFEFAASQGLRSPADYKQSLNELTDRLHKLDNRVVTEPSTSEHNKIYAPIWEKLNNDVLVPLEELVKHIESEGFGSPAGDTDPNYYAKSLSELAGKLDKVYHFISGQLGYCRPAADA